MHLLGCLGFFLFFFLILGISVLGSIVSGIWNLLFGRGHSDYSSSRRTFDQDESRTSRTENQPQGYTFKPDDGEYIDYEEVED